MMNVTRWDFTCVLENAFLIIRELSSLSFSIKRIGHLASPCYYCYLLLVTNCLPTKLSVTATFSTCREYLAENRLSFPSAPHWVRHSYLPKGLWLIPYTCGSSGTCAWKMTFGLGPKVKIFAVSNHLTFTQVASVNALSWTDLVLPFRSYLPY